MENQNVRESSFELENLLSDTRHVGNALRAIADLSIGDGSRPSPAAGNFASLNGDHLAALCESLADLMEARLDQADQLILRMRGGEA